MVVGVSGISKGLPSQFWKDFLGVVYLYSLPCEAISVEGGMIYQVNQWLIFGNCCCFSILRRDVFHARFPKTVLKPT